MGKYDITRLFKDIKNGYPVLASRFHADIVAIVTNEVTVQSPREFI
jgi:hypothetical protein